MLNKNQSKKMEIIDKKEFTDAIEAAYPEKTDKPNIIAIKEDIMDAVSGMMELNTKLNRYVERLQKFASIQQMFYAEVQKILESDVYLEKPQFEDDIPQGNYKLRGTEELFKWLAAINQMHECQMHEFIDTLCDMKRDEFTYISYGVDRAIDAYKFATQTKE